MNVSINKKCIGVFLSTSSMVGLRFLLSSMGFPTTTCIGCRNGIGDLQWRREKNIMKHAANFNCKNSYTCWNFPTCCGQLHEIDKSKVWCIWLPEYSPEDYWSKFDCSSNPDKEFSTGLPPLVNITLPPIKGWSNKPNMNFVTWICPQITMIIIMEHARRK